MRTDFTTIREDLIDKLKSIKYNNGDLSDIGNEIGIILGNHIKDNIEGYEYSSFISGLKHGISLTQGTH